jgi:hypothetical protein
VRPILHQLTEELAAATADGTLPATLGPEQVWVHTSGQVQLLDQPIHGSSQHAAAPLSVSAEERALSLLRQVVLTMLEGLRTAHASGASRIRAPVPEHASALLSGLLGSDRPYQRVSELQQQLQATADRPTRVTTGMRAGHLAVLTALLSVGLIMTFGTALISNGLLVDMLAEELTNYQHALYLLEEERLTQFLHERMAAGETLEANLTIGGEFHGRVNRDDILRFLSDPDTQETLRDSAGQYRHELKRRMDHINRLDRWLLETELDQAAAALARPEAPPTPEFMPADLLEHTNNVALVTPDFMIVFMTVGLVPMILIFPVLWTFWPLLAGPGWSYWVVGISLVRRDGRPAHRLQCAWRALLIWGPVALLLAASVVLQAAIPELGWVAAAVGWFAAILLLVYALLALWFPTRSLHDVLAGTWLVPK